MKITLAFLLLGTSLVLTNAFAIGKKHVHQNESFSHARMMSFPMRKWQELKECHRCSSVEKRCKLRILISDCFLILRIMSIDLRVELKKLLSVRTEIKITYLTEALGNDDVDFYANHVEKTDSLNSFMDFMCLVMQKPMADAGLDFVNILSVVLGDKLGGILDIATGIFHDVLSNVGNVVAGAVDVAGGLTKTASNIVGGVGGAVGDAAKVASGIFGGLTGGVKKVVPLG